MNSSQVSLYILIFCAHFAAMLAPADIQGPHKFPLDLTGQVRYHTGEGITGGYGHVQKGTWTNSKGSDSIVCPSIIIYHAQILTFIRSQ